MGASLAVDPRERELGDVQRELGMTEGFDVGLEMSGNAEALRGMIANMAHGGRIAVLGIPTAETTLHLEPIIFSMLTIKGIYGREMYETWYQMSAMITSGLDIEPVITHHFSHRDFEEASPSPARATRARSSSTGRTRSKGDAVYGTLRDDLAGRLAETREAGTYKTGLVMTTPQGAHVDVTGRGEAPQHVRQQLPRPREPSGDRRGRARHARPGATAWPPSDSSAGRRRCTASSRSGSSFLGTDDTILFSSCFDANGGLFEAILGEEDAVISDQLNRVDHRRHPPLQGAPPPLRERRHGRGSRRGSRKRPTPATG